MLLMDLAHEMKELKEEIEDRRYDMQQGQHHGLGQPSEVGAGPHQRQHRPSLIDLLTGDHSVGKDSMAKPDNTSTSQPTHRDKSHQSSSSSASDERKLSSQKFDSSLPLQKSSIRFVSSVEFKHSSGETSTTPLSPGSPADESSGELSGRPNKPRLQRSKAQSRKTFRLRKSRRSHIEVSHAKVEPSETSPEDGQQQQQEKFSKQQQLQLQHEHKLFSQQQEQKQQTSAVDIPPRKSSALPITTGATTSQQLPNAAVLHAQRLSVHQSRSSENARSSTADVSWDEVSQTSSTSGYKESYSLLMMALECPPTPTGIVAATAINNESSHEPPLASPDAHDLPSTSSATTNQMAAEGSSPDSSINSGEDLALLEHSVPRSSSLHSLFMVFETQDEDTLI
ncbi:hypothetical protein B7P43_G12042 [Cryptotermes secundus]|nr:hypothetical protein B7P43_G12042 [Cryptotermes secundus]